MQAIRCHAALLVPCLLIVDCLELNLMSPLIGEGNYGFPPTPSLKVKYVVLCVCVCWPCHRSGGNDVAASKRCLAYC
jgi:hypothetical protein